MADRAEELFQELQNLDAINALIGQSEDAHFDCKEWPAKDDDAQKMLAKAACGLTNAEGGVLVIGMKAESKPKDEPDVVSSIAPVPDTSLVKSRVLNLIGNLVEPGIVGVTATEISLQTNSKEGFVVAYIPASYGPPRRSRKDWKFYQRIGSGTFPMEYFQIEDKFGKRPHPKLDLYLQKASIRTHPFDLSRPNREFILGITNSGAGVARFPSIRFRKTSGVLVAPDGIDDAGGFGIPQRPSEKEWVSFRGGADDVIYPDETRQIAKLWQTGVNKGREGIPTTIMPMQNGRDIMNRWVFSALTFSFDISCDGIATETFKGAIEEDSVIWPPRKVI